MSEDVIRELKNVIEDLQESLNMIKALKETVPKKRMFTTGLAYSGREIEEWLTKFLEATE